MQKRVKMKILTNDRHAELLESEKEIDEVRLALVSVTMEMNRIKAKIGCLRCIGNRSDSVCTYIKPCANIKPDN